MLLFNLDDRNIQANSLGRRAVMSVYGGGGCLESPTEHWGENERKKAKTVPCFQDDLKVPLRTAP